MAAAAVNGIKFFKPYLNIKLIIKVILCLYTAMELNVDDHNYRK